MAPLDLPPLLDVPALVEPAPIKEPRQATLPGLITLAGMFAETAAPPATHAYTHAGYYSGVNNTIGKYSFASLGNETDVGNSTASKYYCAGNQNSTWGYACGGYTTTYYAGIDKLTYASGGNATAVGSVTQARVHGASASSATYGYYAGGSIGSSRVTTIDKFQLVASASSSSVGALTLARTSIAGATDVAHGYGWAQGGYNTSSNVYDRVDKWPYASDSGATDIGNLTLARYGPSGATWVSGGYGMAAGGTRISTLVEVNNIDKVSFGSGGNSTDVGDLNVAREGPAGQSSETYGHCSGGDTGTYTQQCDRWLFASTANASNVATLLSAHRYGCAGHQGIG